jgi:hypothetical protein
MVMTRQVEDEIHSHQKDNSYESCLHVCNEPRSSL